MKINRQKIKERIEQVTGWGITLICYGALVLYTWAFSLICNLFKTDTMTAWLFYLGSVYLLAVTVWGIFKRTPESEIGIVLFVLREFVYRMRHPRRTVALAVKKIYKNVLEVFADRPGLEHNGELLTSCLGLDDSGNPILVNLGGPEAGNGASLFIAGMSGGGKTKCLLSFLALLYAKPSFTKRCDVYMIDPAAGKPTSLAPFKRVARFAQTRDEANVMLKSLVAIMESRKGMPHDVQAKAKWILLVIDELRSVVLRVDGKMHTENITLLDLLMREGRELKIRVLAMGQYITGTLGISTYEQFALRMVVRAPSAQTAQTTFGARPPIVPMLTGEFSLYISYEDSWVHGHTFDTLMSLVESVVNALPKLVIDSEDGTSQSPMNRSRENETEDDPSLPIELRILRFVKSRRRNKGMKAAQEALDLQSKHQAEEAYKLLRSWGILEKTGRGTSGHIIAKGMTLKEAEAEAMRRLHGKGRDIDSRMENVLG